MTGGLKQLTLKFEDVHHLVVGPRKTVATLMDVPDEDGRVTIRTEGRSGDIELSDLKKDFEYIKSLIPGEGEEGSVEAVIHDDYSTLINLVSVLQKFGIKAVTLHDMEPIYPQLTSVLSKG